MKQVSAMLDNVFFILLLAVAVILGAYYVYSYIRTDQGGVDQTDFIEGLCALLDGDDRRAFQKFREVVSSDSSNVEAYLRIGEIFCRNGKPERALQIHQDLSVRHDLTGRQQLAVFRAITNDYMSLEDFSAAQRSLQRYNKVAGGDNWGLATLLALQEKSGKWEEASATQEKLLKLKGELSRRPMARYKVKSGDSLMTEGQYHQARLAYKEAISLDEKCADAYLAIGDSYMSENRSDDAIGIWKRLVSNAPESAGQALDRLEKALFEVGKFGEIEDICRMVIRLDPHSLDARLKLAEYFTKKADFQSAEEHLLHALDNNPDSYQPALELARLYLKSKKEDKIHNLIGMLERKEEGKVSPLTG
ncbi:MAG: tetratricopeptide repeat protein [candidate division Zixibacteria bacterium]|nr:tetratricopeptide repeat protein [candidate division Zixibacteria bacterium]